MIELLAQMHEWALLSMGFCNVFTFTDYVCIYWLKVSSISISIVWSYYTLIPVKIVLIQILWSET